MKRIARCFQRLLNPSKRNKKENIPSENNNVLPDEINDTEKIARFIFSPINLNSKGNLKSNLYKPPPGLDEISVNRLDYTNADYLKSIALKMQQPENLRSYFGLGIITTIDIRNSGTDVIYTPIIKSTTTIEKNIFHSDIKIGYVVKKGEELPAEINKKIQNLIKNTRLFKDFTPQEISWGGDIPI